MNSPTHCTAWWTGTHTQNSNQDASAAVADGSQRHFIPAVYMCYTTVVRPNLQHMEGAVHNGPSIHCAPMRAAAIRYQLRTYVLHATMRLCDTAEMVCAVLPLSAFWLVLFSRVRMLA